jgi:hypothetical protein
LRMKRYPSCLWWKESRQHVQWDFVKSIVWHTTPEMKRRKRKFMGSHRLGSKFLII